MATQDEARQAIIDAIVEIAPGIYRRTAEGGEQVKALAEAWEIVRVKSGGRVGSM